MNIAGQHADMYHAHLYNAVITHTITQLCRTRNKQSSVNAQSQSKLYTYTANSTLLTATVTRQR